MGLKTQYHDLLQEKTYLFLSDEYICDLSVALHLNFKNGI